jgi:NADH-quinone oxidoreductase subunit F
MIRASRSTWSVNGSEGEPGSFKDYMLMRKNPYQLLEVIVIAAYAIGAKKAFLGIKASSDKELSAVTRAFDEMSKRHALDPTPIELVLGPEDYPFGEEKALLEVVEGPGPLHREADNPPYVKGLFITDPSEPNPTGVNNVGTLFHTSSNKARHSSGTTGTPDSPGTMTLRNELAKHGFPAVWQILLDTADTEPVRMHPCAANRLDHRKA